MTLGLLAIPGIAMVAGWLASSRLGGKKKARRAVKIDDGQASSEE
jgi:hypothetical protein